VSSSAESQNNNHNPINLKYSYTNATAMILVNKTYVGLVVFSLSQDVKVLGAKATETRGKP